MTYSPHTFMKLRWQSHKCCDLGNLLQNITPEIPQSEIAATNFLRRARNRAKIFKGVFVLCSLCRITQKTSAKNSPQFITPCPANEMSKFIGFDNSLLRRLAGILLAPANAWPNSFARDSSELCRKWGFKRWGFKQI